MSKSSKMDNKGLPSSSKSTTSTPNVISMNSKFKRMQWAPSWEANNPCLNGTAVLALANRIAREINGDEYELLIEGQESEAHALALSHWDKYSVGEYMKVIKPGCQLLFDTMTRFSTLNIEINTKFLKNQSALINEAQNQEKFDLQERLAAANKQLAQRKFLEEVSTSADQSSRQTIIPAHHGSNTNPEYINVQNSTSSKPNVFAPSKLQQNSSKFDTFRTVAPNNLRSQNNSGTTTPWYDKARSDNGQEPFYENNNQNNMFHQTNYQQNNHPNFNSNNNPNNNPNNFPNNGQPDDWSTMKTAVQELVHKKRNKKPKIGRYPEIWDRSKHGTMRAFGQFEFARWANSQGLNENQSTVFFCHCFKKRLHVNQIQELSCNHDGSPKFDTVAELIEQVIQQMNYDEEALKHLVQRFMNRKVGLKSELDAEFMEFYDLRKQGWPYESVERRLEMCKEHYADGLNTSDTFHRLIKQNTEFNAKWAAASSMSAVCTILRTQQNRYNSDRNQSGNSSNYKSPTNDHNNGTTPMEGVTNVEEAQASQQAPTEVNNVGKSKSAKRKRKCKNSACGKEFIPRLPYFTSCSVECSKTARAATESAGTKKAFGSKAYNSGGQEMNAIGEVNTSSNGQVSTGNDLYIVRFHLTNPVTQAPVIVKDGLFDTGAGPTLCRYSLLEKLNLTHLIDRSPQKPLFAGDQSVMDGAVGAIKVKCTVEDSTCSTTEYFSINVLVYNTLNHDVVVGQNMMRMFRKFECYPKLNVLLINPTLKTTRFYNKRNDALFYSQRKVTNSSISNMTESRLVTKQSVSPEDILESSTPRMIENSNSNNFKPRIYEISTVQHKTPKRVRFADSKNPNLNYKAKTVKSRRTRSEPTRDPAKFDETERFYLTVPKNFECNRNNFALFEEETTKLACNFMQEVEKKIDMQSNNDLMADIMTEGGMDGLIESEPIKVFDTKTVKTKWGDVQVGQNISPAMEKQVKEYFDSYTAKTFDNTQLGCAKTACNPQIDPTKPPITQASRYMPLNPHLKTEAASMVENMMKLGVLIETNKPANSTIFIVQKQSGKWRLICDLRKYNSRIIDYVVHLPSPYELINKISSFELFSYFDYPDAFFQIPLSAESMKLAPIVASVAGCSKNVQYVKMPQGLSVATAWFCDAMIQTYRPIEEYVANYLDDSVVGSRNDENEHFSRIKRFINITEEAGLRLKLEKCVLFATNITFLNYTIAHGKWSLSEAQKATINTLNAKNLTKEKRESLAAFLQHFNRFTTGISHAARKIRDVSMSEDEVSIVLNNVKRKLTNSQALCSVDFESELHIYVDASEFDVAGVILQKGKNGTQLVTCWSKKLPKVMVNKPIHEKELYAGQFITKTYKYLLIGSHKKVFFWDSKTIVAAQNSKAPTLRCLFDTIKATYGNVEIKFISTKKNPSDIFTRQAVNSIAQNKSRRACVKVLPRMIHDKILKMHMNAACQSAPRLLVTFVGLAGFESLKLADVQKVLESCELCKSLENGVKPRKASPGITLSRELTSQDCIYIDHKVILNKERLEKMADKAIEADPNWEPDTDREYSVLTVFEPLSSITWAYPVKSYTTEIVKTALRIYFQLNGAPGAVVADNHKSFVALGGWLQYNYNCSLHHTSAYHPCSNLSERCHLEFEKILAKFEETKSSFKYEDWEDELAKCVIAMNSMKHTSHKVSPLEVFKNRTIVELEPLKFHPTNMELKMKQEKFTAKIHAVAKSKLKCRMPVYERGQEVKVMMKNAKIPINYGIVASYKDFPFAHAVRVKMMDESGKYGNPIAINKNNICIAQNAPNDENPVAVEPNE